MTMADAEGVMNTEMELVIPHLAYDAERLDALYPRLVAPGAVDTEDLIKDDEDLILQEGYRLVRDLVTTCSTSGRRRRS